MRFLEFARLAALLSLVALLAACDSLLGPPVVYGAVAFREPSALPSNARLEVTMVELKSDGSVETVANTAVDNPGSPPIRFALAYDPKRIDENGRYAIEATVRAGERVLYRSDERVAVLTGDAPSRVTLLLSRAPVPPPPPPVVKQTPAERAVAAIRARLDKLDKITGAYNVGDVDATYEAFLDGQTLVAMREARKLGGQASAQVAFYYREGTLLAYEEEAQRLPPGAAAGAPLQRTTLDLQFAGGRYSAGRKTVNGTPGQPNEREIRDAVAEGQAARDRLVSDAAAGRTSTGLGPLRFGCADGSEFFVTFGREPLRAIVSAVGHPSAVLLPVPVRAGYRFGAGRTDLRGSGREATVRWEGAQPVRCTAATP